MEIEGAGVIEGAGGGGKGGGGKPYVPREDPNTLQSNAVARVIDVLGEGPIVGLVDDLSSIYFDETPLRDAGTGVMNFMGAKVLTRLGTPDQLYVGEFPAIESEVAVGVQVTNGTPVIRTVTDPDVDRLRVTVSVAALYKITDKGDMLAHEVDFALDVRPSGGDWQPLLQSTGAYVEVTGGATSTGQATTAIRVTVDAEITQNSEATRTERGAGQVIYTNNNRLVHDWYVQYRKVGTSNWLVLANETVLAANNSARQRTFTKTGLDLGIYEVNMVHGTLAKLERVNGNIIRLSGKNTSVYERDYVVTLPAGGAPWDVRMRRVSADETSDKIQSDTYFARYTEIQDHKLTYPDTAYLAVRLDAEQFAGKIPSRAYLVDGLQIKMPSNYDPVTRAYTGSWDGTFQTAWTNNPAWIFYDLCTNSRYGLGKWVEAATVDKWGLYAIARYCDELVADGEGGLEPRYTCNVVLNSRDEAFRVLQLLASVCRSKAFWGSSVITLAQDRPKDPSIIVSPANVINGEFSYAGTGLKARHNVAFVTWNDPDDFYRPAIEVVEDQAAVRRYGWRQTDLVAFGCTSRGQAIRMGKWLLDTEQHETETVTYRASFDHMIADGTGVTPGDIILVADPAYANVRYGGRIRTVLGGKTFRLDAAVGAGPGHLFSVVLPDGTVAERSFSLEGVSDTIVVDEQFSPLPLDGAMWAITAPSAAPRPFQVLSVRETEKNLVEVTALFHDATKFDRIERDIPGKPAVFSRQTTGPLRSPGSVTLKEQLYKVNAALMTRVVIGWVAPKDERVGYYELRYRVDGGAWVTRQTFDTSLSIETAEAGRYDLLVYARSTGYGRSTAAQLYGVQVLGKTAPPGDVEGLTAHTSVTGVELRWNEVTDLDLVGYEVREGKSWDEGTVIAKNLVSTHIFVTINDTAAKFFRVRAVDQLGLYSINVATVGTKVTAPPAPVSFEARSQGDRMYFQWQPGTSEAGVLYEIRAGASWGLGSKITLTGGSSTVILYPGTGPKTFWIKAVSRVGLFSAQALFYTLEQELDPDRNVVLDYDNADDGGAGLYPGTSVFMEPGFDDTLVLAGNSEGDFTNFGEHSFPVDLGQTVLARNWLSFAPVLAPAELSWDQWIYAWDAPESAIAWVPTADEGEVTVTPFIMRRTNALASGDLFGFALNGTAASYDGAITPFEEDGTAYEPARYGQGLLVEDVCAVGWDVTVPEEFALAFKVALRGRSLRDSVIIQLSDTGSGRRLQLGYDEAAACFFLADPDGSRIEASLSHAVEDFLSIGIAQASAERTLFLASEVFGTATQQSAAIPPAGSFDRLQLHG